MTIENSPQGTTQEEATNLTAKQDIRAENVEFFNIK